MSAIGKGDWVQCIDACTHVDQGPGPQPGDVLMVCEVIVLSRVLNCGCRGEHVGLRFTNNPEPTLFGAPASYCLPAFRPLGGNAWARTRKAPAELEPA